MSALTLVMKEVDMNAEEFVNVRAYHSRWSGKSLGDDALQSLVSPTSSDESSGVDSLPSEEEPAAPATAATKKTGPWKDLTSLVVVDKETDKVTDKDKQTPPRNDKKDFKIIYEGRNILNLERNLQPHQWQLRSPLFNALNLYMKPKSSFRFLEKSGALDELMMTCSDCDYREPILF